MRNPFFLLGAVAMLPIYLVILWRLRKPMERKSVNRGLAARGRSTFFELRWYPPMEAAKGSLSWVFRAKQPESVRTGP